MTSVRKFIERAEADAARRLQALRKILTIIAERQARREAILEEPSSVKIG